jgi:hypothetical protein
MYYPVPVATDLAGAVLHAHVYTGNTTWINEFNMRVLTKTLMNSYTNRQKPAAVVILLNTDVQLDI